jgi:hypothetical protein
VTFDIEAGCCLRLEDVFPDGVPDKVTADVVMAELKKEGSLRDAISEWDLFDDLSLSVSVGLTFATWSEEE